MSTAHRKQYWYIIIIDKTDQMISFFANAGILCSFFFLFLTKLVRTNHDRVIIIIIVNDSTQWYYGFFEIELHAIRAPV